ncbi:hypothetical protein L0665_06020 [Methanogenium marinum]|uniref:Uncharacterized protein n=1 Tax=Methanogenium marinum TaxID=348610 RepID=A0A9Q4KT21_9EURY|nr:hypothetical protein [Methanogenium marinum]MDE4908164.1 hypothetical protein [Methanogenium marinum]
MENFKGRTAHRAWDDFVYSPKARSVERIALLVDENRHGMARWLFRMFTSIAHIKVRFFQLDDVTGKPEPD